MELFLWTPCTTQGLDNKYRALDLEPRAWKQVQDLSKSDKSEVRPERGQNTSELELVQNKQHSRLPELNPNGILSPPLQPEK